MDSNKTTTCCWYFQLKPFPTIEEIFDDNNNDLLIIHKHNENNNIFPKKMLNFYSKRIELGQNLFMIHKESTDGKIVITLTYNDENGNRKFMNGNIYMNKKMHIVSEFKIVENIEGNYDYAKCIWF
jgi:hypothetical protein